MLGKKSGGLENNLVSYAYALSKIGYKVTVFVDPKAKILLQLAYFPEINIAPIKQINSWDIFAKVKLFWLLKKIKPLLVFMIGNRAINFILPFKNHITCIPITSNYNLSYLIKHRVSIAMTRDLQNKILSMANNHTCYLLPNPILKPKVVAKAASSPLVIGSLGRFVEKKGFKTLVSALQILKLESIPFKAIIAGEGKLRADIENLIKELGLEQDIALPGWMNQADFYSAIDIFVLPSYHEPFGNVVVEAFSCGKPAICSDTEGPLEITSDRHDAVIVPKHDNQALALAIKELITTPNLRLELSKNAKQTYNNKFSQTVFQKNLDAVINKIIKKPPNHGQHDFS